MTARTKWMATIPALLMLGVALVQVQLVRTAQLCPWKGGGFGMFASLDVGPNRRVRAYLVTDGLETSAKPASPRLRELAQKAGTLPSRAHLDRYALALGEQARKEDHRPQRVRVEVWRQQYAPLTFASEQVLLAESSVDLE